jgi:hypothetical protein
MDLLDSKSDAELMKSMICEIAKTINEVRCAQNDLSKAQSRLSFLIVLSNTLSDRLKEKDNETN